MPTSDQIRQQFIDYFREKHEHTFVPSSPVVPHDDPSLLFTNAGMNQFKDVFLGTGSRDYTRAVNTQKCIRAGGKHNDLEDVGKDTYHHTFFEMLGNWSFGDYFKREAIRWAWDLLTNVWGLDKSRLHATVFEGDAALELEPDREAAELWKEETDIDPTHIHFGDKKDNFWEMGETGPCGPCSEIHYDRTPDRSGAGLVNADDPRVIEIWNLVFIQFNRNSAGLLTPLPAQHVDTGMGFERIAAVLQDKDSNYDTDVFKPLFDVIREVTGARPYGEHAATADESLADPIDVAYRVIADHVRCLTFALTDGAVPSNEGRGYVLRRILRRAVRHGRQTLGVHDPFLHRLVDAVVDTMGHAFPELKQKPDFVRDLIRDEEESFGRTIDRGIELFEQAAERGGDRITGDDAFKLYDTYGFPLDLTQVMAEERGMRVDVERFTELMEQQREQSRAGGAVSGDERAALVELVQQQQLPATTFLGYDETFTAEITSPVHVYAFDESAGYAETDHLSVGMHGAIVVDQTPFYAEAGGQVGDHGVIKIEENGGGRFRVEDTLKFGETTFHLGRVEEGAIDAAARAAVSLQVDEGRRRKIMANHTATHMLNRALRVKVNAEADQKGSLVDDARLRFDFSQRSALSPEQIGEVESMVMGEIAADMPVYAADAPQQQALRIKGLRAVFGEKYPDPVRVVSIGVPVEQMLSEPEREEWTDYSVEFCGGTHLSRTAEAEAFVIVGEEAVAKGVRRLVALTGEAARDVRHRGESLLRRLEPLRTAGIADEQGMHDEVAELSQAVNEQTLPATVRHELSVGLGEIQRRLKEDEKQRMQQAAEGVVDQARRVAEEADGEVIVARFDQADANALRKAMDVLRKKKPDAALLLAGVAGEKVSFVAAVPQPKIEQGLKAGDWVKETAQVVGGGGGGKPDMAQAGGKDPAKVDEALEKAREIATARIE